MAADLVDYLFTNYSSNLIPLCSSGGNVTLRMDVALRQIMDMVSNRIVFTTRQLAD